MTIIQAIQQVDGLKPNTYSTKQKILWLSRLEAMVKTLVIDAHEGGEKILFGEFTEDTDLETVLFLAAPFDVAYLYWLEAQIHYANEEIGLYNNAMGMFHAAFRAYQADYKRNHSAKAAGRFRF